MTTPAKKKDERRRVQLVVRPALFRTLGIDPETAGQVPVNDALTRYARHLTTASREVARTFRRDEWSYLADACNGVLWDGPDDGLVAALAAQAEDAELLNGLGAKWFGDAGAAKKTAGLVAKLKGLTEIQADAAVTAVRWFWDNHESIDLAEDPWWTVAYRTAAVDLDGRRRLGTLTS